MALCENLDIYTKPPTPSTLHQLPLIGGFPQSSSISTLLLLFLFTGGGFLKAPMSANGAAHMSLKAASNLLHFSIETVDANHDGSTDSVIHFDPSNSVTLLGVANLTAHDFLFL